MGINSPPPFPDIEMPDEIQFRILVKIASLVGMKKQSLRAQSVLNLINKITE